MADVDMYIDSKYMGFQTLPTIDRFYREYERRACEIVPELDDGEIVLFAILLFEEDSERFISADFMTLRMPYETYLETYSKLSKGCRMCFRRKPREQKKMEEKHEKK